MRGTATPDKGFVKMRDLAGQLRLLARDKDDVAVVSALLQDAIIPGADMEFKRKTNQFFIVANRFCWEIQPSCHMLFPLHQRPIGRLNIMRWL